MKKSLYVLIAVIAIGLTSCSHQIMNYNSLVPQTTDIKANYESKGGKVSAKGGTIDKATAKALQLAGRDYNAIINGTITMYQYNLILVNITTFKVEGTPVKLIEHK